MNISYPNNTFKSKKYVRNCEESFISWLQGWEKLETGFQDPQLSINQVKGKVSTQAGHVVMAWQT